MRKSMFRIALALTVIASFVVFGALAQKGRKSSPEPKERGWSVSYTPFIGSGFRNLDVGVVTVTSARAKGVTGVVVKNRSDEAVNAIELSWYLTAKRVNGAILEQGRTGIIELETPLQPGESTTVSYELVQFEKTSSFHEKELLRDYSISVSVSEARFVSNRAWQIPIVNDLTPDESLPISKVIPPAGPCADQECKLKANGTAYECVAKAGVGCTNSPDGQTCANTICQ